MADVTLAQAAIDIRTNIKLGIPTLVIGPVGVGKTDVVRQAAKALNALVIDKRASQMEPTDLAVPMPDIATRKVIACLQEWLPDSVLAAQYPVIVLLLDELTDAQIGTQAALNQLVLERELPGYRLPNNVQIVATGNRGSDRAAAQKVSRAMSNRFSVVTIMVDVKAWLQWAASAGLSPELIAYVQNADRQNLGSEALHKYPSAGGSDAAAFVTPRSLARCDLYFKAGLPDNELRRLISYSCGDDTAADIMNFLATWRLVPDINAIIADPLNARLHREPSVNYALTVALVSKLSLSNIAAIAVYVKRLDRLYQAAFWSNATGKDASFAETPEHVAFLISQSQAA